MTRTCRFEQTREIFSMIDFLFHFTFLLRQPNIINLCYVVFCVTSRLRSIHISVKSDYRKIVNQFTNMESIWILVIKKHSTTQLTHYQYNIIIVWIIYTENEIDLTLDIFRVQKSQSKIMSEKITICSI